MIHCYFRSCSAKRCALDDDDDNGSDDDSTDEVPSSSIQSFDAALSLSNDLLLFLLEKG